MAAVDFPVTGRFNQVRAFAPGPSFTTCISVAHLVTQVRGRQPGGVDAILIGQLPAPGFKIAPPPNGIIAILIGLLLPAVQKLAEPGSTDLQALKGLLKPGGSIGVVLGDGSVRFLVGPSNLAFQRAALMLY